MTGDVISMDDETHRCRTKKVCAYGNQFGDYPVDAALDIAERPGGRDHAIAAIVAPSWAPYRLIASMASSPIHHTISDHAESDRHAEDGPFNDWARGFMDQEWDGGDIAFRPDTSGRSYRVMKPGAHIAAFGATRTFHRMMVAIEDAGFEIRDTLMWLYGQGFPKTKNVALAIDKRLGHPNRGRAIPTASSARPAQMVPSRGQSCATVSGKIG